MGIYSRDYARETPSPSGFLGPATDVCKKLIIANVAVFILQLFTRHPPQVGGSVVGDWLSLGVVELLHGQVWRLVTYAFCHNVNEGFPFHLLFNMLFLWWFGKTLEGMYGSREFLLFYLTAAIAAGFVFVGIDAATKNVWELRPVEGASGAIMAIVIVYAMYFPRHRIYIWGVIPIEIRWVAAAYVVMDLLPVLSAFNGTAERDNVAHTAHLGGAAMGFLYKTYNWRISSMFSGWRLPRLGNRSPHRRKEGCMALAFFD